MLNQYTLDDYEQEGLEPWVPPLRQRIETFKRFVDILGFGSVVWRFDPLILTDKISIEDLLGKIEGIGNQLKGFSEKLVFSLADISSYRKASGNLTAHGINYKEWTEAEMRELSSRFADINHRDGWGFYLAEILKRVCGASAKE